MKNWSAALVSHNQAIISCLWGDENDTTYKYHPAVKFQNIEADVFHCIQLNLDDTADVSKDTKSDSEDEDKCNDTDNNIEDGSQDITFQVDSDIDIDLCALRDMISHDPIII